jgi:hexaprenyl-diphosphate synthase
MDNDGAGEGERTQVLEMLKKYGSLDKARAVAEDYASKAVSSLDAFPSSEAKEILIALPIFVIKRSH